jgi:hypothetical protein
MQVHVHLGLIRKLKLSKDLDAMLAALSRACTAAGARARMQAPSLALVR